MILDTFLSKIKYPIKEYSYIVHNFLNNAML